VNQELYNAAQAVLVETGEKLRALGLACTVAPMSLPQGTCLNLLVGESQQAAAAAYVALGRGGQDAHVSATSASFAIEVADVLAEEAINYAARRPHG
jgi:hypothetical protein